MSDIINIKTYYNYTILKHFELFIAKLASKIK